MKRDKVRSERLRRINQKIVDKAPLSKHQLMYLLQEAHEQINRLTQENKRLYARLTGKPQILGPTGKVLE